MMVPDNQVLARREEGEEQPSLHRVLWTHDNQVALFELGARALPNWTALEDVLQGLSDGNLSLVDDPFCVRPNGRLSEAEKARRDDRMNIIRPLVDDQTRLILFPETRWRTIRARALGVGSAPDHVLDLLRLWWKYGQLQNALVPNFFLRGRGDPDSNRKSGQLKRGRPRLTFLEEQVPVGINVNDEVRKHFGYGYDLCKRGYSTHAAYAQVVRLYYSEAREIDGERAMVALDDRPSQEQFSYWFRKIVSKTKLLVAVKGAEAVARNHRQRPGNPAQIAFGPGSYFQIDATVANVHVRSRIAKGREIGRPFVYIVTDIFSGMIVGFAVTLTLSWEGVSAALENAFTDKVLFCSRYGVNITEAEWPSRHIPQNLDGDRGGEVVGAYIGNVAADLNFALNNMPPYRPDLKGFVEGHFSILTKGWKHVPGASAAHKRGDRRRNTEITLTLDGFVTWMIEHARKHNASATVNRYHEGFPYEDRKPTPLELWKWGCETFGAPRAVSRESVRMSLMCKGTCKESDKGLVFKRLRYVPVGGFKDDMSFRYKGKKWRTFDHLFDSRDVSTIEVYEPGRTDTALYELAPIDRKYRGWTLDEVEAERKLETVGARVAETLNITNNNQFHERTQALYDREVEEQGKPIVTKEPKADAEARRAEKRAIQAREARSKHPDVTPIAGPASKADLTARDDAQTTRFPGTPASRFGGLFDEIFSGGR